MKVSDTAIKRGSYKCGKCGELGHNARRCASAPKPSASKSSSKLASKPAAEVTEAETASQTETVAAPESTETAEEPASQPQVAISETQDLTVNRRQNTRPTAPASPFECPACNRVGILVLVVLDDGRKALRCEHCYTKVQSTSILKWGARPEDKPPEVSRGSATRSFF